MTVAAGRDGLRPDARPRPRTWSARRPRSTRRRCRPCPSRRSTDRPKASAASTVGPAGAVVKDQVGLRVADVPSLTVAYQSTVVPAGQAGTGERRRPPGRDRRRADHRQVGGRRVMSYGR